MKQKNNIKHPHPRRFLKRAFTQSIFAKYFLACSAIMVASFLVLGTALVFFSLKYNNNEKQDLYINGARNISNTLEQTLKSNSEVNDARWSNFFKTTLSLSAKNLDASIYIVNKSGDVDIVALPNGLILRSNDTFSKKVINIVNNLGEIKEDSTLDGYFDTNFTVAGTPVKPKDGNNVQYSVFVCSKSTSTISIVSGIFKIFLYCVCLILIASFIVIYIVTRRLTYPLRQMSNAVKSFSKGDFSARIPVKGNDEIGQLSASFNNMASSLASLEDMRSSFVANVSHELKTPMTSIAGFIDGILDGTIPPEKERHYLEIVSTEVKRLSRLVKSFLDTAKIQSGEYKVSPTEFDVLELIRRVIIGFEQQIDKKQLDIRGLDLDGRYLVYADYDITYQIVNNLVDNAVKFSNQGGYLQINLATKDKKVFVGVKNSGIGIPTKDLPYVFDRFYKTDKSRSQDKKGVGLGLYIVKTILNYQGHDIWVRSVEHEYCEFVFTLSEKKK